MTGTHDRIWSGMTMALGALTLLGVAEWGLRIRYRQRARPAVGETADRITLVALGDSIAAGWPGSLASAWPNLLRRHLSTRFPEREWRVIGAGVPGDTAPMGYARFESDVAAVGPGLVLIAFGLNDCSLARHGMDRWFECQIPRGLALRSYVWRAIQVRAGRWGRGIGLLDRPFPEREPVAIPRTSAEGFAAALMALVDRVRVIGAQPILLTMTPISQAASTKDRTVFHAASRIKADESIPLSPKIWGKQHSPRIGGRGAIFRTGYTVYARYNAVIAACAAKTKVPLVIVSDGAPSDSFEADGVHLTAVGQAWVAARVYEQLRERDIWASVSRPKMPR